MRKTTTSFLRVSLLCALFVSALLTKSQAQNNRNWLWAQTAGDIYGSNGQAVTTDGAGNVYASGYYGSHIFFANDSLTSPDSLATNFQQNVFLAKYDATGKVLWAKSGTGDYASYATAVTTDKNNNVYMAGYFRSHKITFGGMSATNSTYGKYDIFLVKYDKDGNIQWLKSWGGSDNDEANAVKADANGNVTITGFFASTTFNFGLIPLTNVSTDGHSDVFVMQVDANGKEIWGLSYGGSDDDIASAITVDASNNVYVAGYFNSPSLIFSSVTLGNDSNISTQDVFLAKFSSAGIPSWAVKAGGGQVDEPSALTCDASGNLYMTGRYSSKLLSLGSKKYGNIGSYDVFVAKFDGTGNITWSSVGNGDGDDESRGIVVDGSGNVFVTGTFDSRKLQFGGTSLSTRGGSDMFIVKYNADGSMDFAKQAGNDGDETANAIAVDNSGYIYVVGAYNSTIVSFDSPPVIGGNGTDDMYLAKMDNKDAAGVDIVSNNGSSHSFKVFPNPSQSVLNIAGTQAMSGAGLLEMFDAYGRRVFSSSAANFNGSTIDISNLPVGIYSLKISQGSSIEVVKVVKN